MHLRTPTVGAAGALAFVLTLLPSAVPPQGQSPLPRWREGGTPYDANQSLLPRAIQGSHPQSAKTPPKTGLIASPPEYSPVDGVLFRYGAGWEAVVIDCVVALTADPAHDEKAYVVCNNQVTVNAAATAFANAGADMSKVVFHVQAADSIWIRDFGPHFAWQADTRVIADSHYYPTRPRDNFIPWLLATEEFLVPPYAEGLYYSGGNFQPGPNRSGFVTALVNLDNPTKTNQEIADIYQAYQGIDTLHIMPQLPFTVDGTGHIDMWMYLVDEDDVIISEFKPGSNATAIQITENAVPYMQSLGFTVHRTPAWNAGGTHYTYTNAFRVNDRIFTIMYGPGNPNYLADDQAAAAAWAAAAGPNVELIPINCYSIIPAAGAIHCIVMQVPRVTNPQPAVHVLAPAGGEVVPVLTQYDIRWSADDDVSIGTVDLLYSTDGGATFPHTIATGEVDDGHYAWSVPLLASTQGVIKVVAHDGSGNQTEAVSSAPFQVVRARTRTYDFSVGAGVDRWAWGYRTLNWSELDGVRYPPAASTEVSVYDQRAYGAMAFSDATGGDTDPYRYIPPAPGTGYESTHVFEFTLTETPSCLREITLTWEGYGDACMEAELYVWDDVQGNWCDLEGQFGLDRYAANFAGNRDEVIEAHITTDFHRYVDVNGHLTFLLYSDRNGQRTFHDYVSVRTTKLNCP